MTVFDVIIIGGGAAGMMAGVVAARRGKQVLIIEKNASLGEKLKITGGGRCNITNAEDNLSLLLENYGKAQPFLYSAFSQFGVNETFQFFEELGLSLIVQAQKRAFPVTEKASDVYKVLATELDRLGVEIQTNTTVTQLLGDQDHITAVVCKNDKTYNGTSYILATGGLSRPETGSTGDGFHWLETLEHRVAKPSPHIVPLAVRENWIKQLAGRKFSNCKITFFVEKSKAFHLKGDILCTHFGISGPLILNAAKKVSTILLEGTVTAQIDLYPQLNHQQLDKHIVKIFHTYQNKQLKNIIKHIFPGGNKNIIIELLPEIDLDTPLHSINKHDRKRIVHLAKALPLTIIGLMGYDKAVVANGGVELSEIHMQTMQSKYYQNLYIVGDLLNITRPSGGYSLQLCWTTAFVAGSNV